MFYSRSGYSTTQYKDWVPYLKELNRYAEERGSHLIGSAGGKTVQSWIDICRTIEDCGLPMVELNFGCPHPAMMPGVHGGSMIGQDPDVPAEVCARVCEAVKHSRHRQADARPVAARSRSRAPYGTRAPPR